MPPLNVGDRVPDITLQAHDGSTVRLADMVGRRPLVLFFYPKDDTPICTKEACAFRDSYETSSSPATPMAACGKPLGFPKPSVCSPGG